MTARSTPIPRTDSSDDVLSFDEVATSKTAAILAAAFGFICFMPYPAIGVGNNSAIQMGNVATVIALLCASIGVWEGVSLATLFLVLMPRCASTLKVLLLDSSDASLCFKATVGWALTLLTVVAVQIHAPRHIVCMLTGIAIAMLVHVAVGAYQIYSFSSGVFPLVDLYVNPSFLSVQDNAIKLARWEQRPFGIFPEPSAMSSCLGPFVIFFAAICMDLVRLKRPIAAWQRHLFAAAAMASVGLIILSKSGHAVPTVGAVVLMLLIWLNRARATFKTFFLITLLFGVALPVVLYFAYNAMNSRMGGGGELGNDSWEERYTSLVVGFKAWSGQGLATGIFGLGPGLSSDVVKNTSGIVSVFSLLFSYFYDCGLFGLVAIAWVGERLFKTWKGSSFNFVFVAIAINWIVAVTFTTSYGQLLPLWITLGLLSAWLDVCEVSVASIKAPVARPRRRRTKRTARISPWTPPSLAGANLEEPQSS